MNWKTEPTREELQAAFDVLKVLGVSPHDVYAYSFILDAKDAMAERPGDFECVADVLDLEMEVADDDPRGSNYAVAETALKMAERLGMSRDTE